MKIETIEGVYQTSRGYPVIILATGLDDAECRVAGIVHYPDGANLINLWPSLDDLVKIPQLSDLNVNDRIMVRDSNDAVWERRYFAGKTENGRVWAFNHGQTSWSSMKHATLWNQWRLPTEDEL